MGKLLAYIKEQEKKCEKEILKRIKETMPETIELLNQNKIERAVITKEIILVDYGYVEIIDLSLVSDKGLEAIIRLYESIDGNCFEIQYDNKNKLGEKFVEIIEKEKNGEDDEVFAKNFVWEITNFPDYDIYKKLNTEIRYK